MSTGQRNYFDNPYERRGDISHASIFLVALVLLIGVAVILIDGDGTVLSGALPSDTSALVPTDLSGALSKLASTSQVRQPSAVPAAAAKPEAGAAPSNGQAADAQAVVANAPNGVFLTRTPNPADRLIAWPNGTPLQLLGEEQDVQGVKWVKVRDPRGNVGWLPKQNVQPRG